MASLVAIPTLFRGDSLPKSVRPPADPAHRGRTFPDRYITEGLVAKHADEGSPAIFRKPLSYLVAAHSGYERGTEEEVVSKHSPFIALSTKEETAWRFMDRTGKRRFTPCELWEATHLMWKLQGVRAPKVSVGRFRLSYRSSTENVDRYFQRQMVEAIANLGPGLIRAIATLYVHANLDSDTDTHVVDIIDVATFLQASTDLSNAGLRIRAIERAKQWTEWLVFPCDLMPDGNGYDTHFWPNEFLDVHIFAKQIPKTVTAPTVSTPRAKRRSPRRT